MDVQLAVNSPFCYQMAPPHISGRNLSLAKQMSVTSENVLTGLLRSHAFAATLSRCCIKLTTSQVWVAHACNPNIKEVWNRKIKSSRLSLVTQEV